MINNQSIQDAFEMVKENHTESEAVQMLLNSLVILGAKKVQVQDHLDESSFKSINKYKYPERLASFLKTSNEKSLEWQDMSFAKIALS
jgi:hypothetical protein